MSIFIYMHPLNLQKYHSTKSSPSSTSHVLSAHAVNVARQRVGNGVIPKLLYFLCSAFFERHANSLCLMIRRDFSIDFKTTFCFQHIQVSIRLNVCFSKKNEIHVSNKLCFYCGGDVAKKQHQLSFVSNLTQVDFNFQNVKCFHDYLFFNSNLHDLRLI